MTRHFLPPAPEPTSGPSFLVQALRCWRNARDSGQFVQPRLWRLFSGQGRAMLAPAFDSLCRAIEASLGRQMTVGCAQPLSNDERLLLGLLDGSRRCEGRGAEPEGRSSLLDCAIRSARIMIAMTASSDRERNQGLLRE